MTTKRILAATLGVISVTIPFSAGAKTYGPPAVGSVTTQTFGYDHIAIVPGNPFYDFGKMFGNVEDYFSSDNVLSRLQGETDQINEVAAELVTVYQIGPKNNKLLVRSLTEYQRAVYRYVFALSHATAADMSADILKTMSLTLSRHVRFTDDIAGWSYRTNAQTAVLNDLTDKMNTAAISALNSTLPVDTFISTMTDGLSEQSAIEQVRTAEMLDVLAKVAANSDNNGLAKQLLDARTNILLGLARSADVSDFVTQLSSAAGSPAERLQTLLFLLSAPGLQANATLIDLKNQLLIKAF